MQHRALDLAAVAHRTLMEAARHPGIGHDPARPHRVGEGRMARDPVVDGAGKLAELTAAGSGMSGGRHDQL